MKTYKLYERRHVCTLTEILRHPTLHTVRKGNESYQSCGRRDIPEKFLTAALTLPLFQPCIFPPLPVLCQDCDVLGSDEGLGCKDDRVIKGIDCGGGRGIAMCVQNTLADSQRRSQCFRRYITSTPFRRHFKLKC